MRQTAADAFRSGRWAGRSSDRHVALARDAALQDGNGLAFRVRVLEDVPSVELKWSGYLAPQVDEIARAGIDVDLLIDLEYLEPDFELRAADLAPVLQDLIEARQWRAVAILGTSVPATMGCIPEGTMGSLPRREWQLWLELGACDLPRMPCFGDYAIQHPRPPQEGGGPGMRANIRYTCRRGILIARGSGWVAQEGNAQYVLLCKQLLDRQWGLCRCRLQLGRWSDRPVLPRSDGAGGAGHVARRRHIATTSNSLRTSFGSDRLGSEAASANARLPRIPADDRLTHDRLKLHGAR